MSLAAQLTSSGRGVNGSAYFIDGMSSVADPMFISDRAVRYAENILHRGGSLRTRPGYRKLLDLPEGKLQGATYFRPIGGEAYVVVAVAGKLYTAQHPFSEYVELPGVQLYQYADRVYFSSATRSAVRNSDGTVQSTEPVRTLLAQDGGYTRAAYWDGATSGHVDPTRVLDSENNVLTAGTPLGGPMAWSGGRLWVARRNKLFASDIENPLSFSENQYLAEGGFFSFDDNILALAEIPQLTDPVLLVFTRTRTYSIRSGIRTRSTWKDVANFQDVFLPSVGCVSSRGVAAQNGLLWWMTPTGLTNMNAAQQARISSSLVPQDMPMSLSKSQLSEDLSGVALGSHENFLLCSVPHADKYNAHTWVYDQAVTDSGSQSWAGVWTGTRPVEWISGLFGGAQRLLYVSQDYDGTARLWQAFHPEPKDNGFPISTIVETKTHIDFSERATGLNRKKFVFAEVTLGDIQGNVTLSVYWAGTRGKYKKLGDWTIVATEGALRADQTVSAEIPIESYQPQHRTIRTPEVKQDPAAACSTRGVEANVGDWIDIGFSLAIRWSGRASLRSYRIFVDPEQESGTGVTPFVETGPRVLSGSVCS